MATHEATTPIVRVPSARLSEAVGRVLLMGRRPSPDDARRFIDYAIRAGIPLDQCWAVERRGELGPVILALPNAGRTALVFASPAEREHEVDELARLVRWSLDRMDRRRVALAQALLERHEGRQLEAFLRGGMERLADLAYFERLAPAPNHADPPRWPQQCTLEPWRAEIDEDFKVAVQSSYEGTRDCPKLCGLRSIDDVMAGHRAAGQFEPDLWTLVRWQGEPAAALLLSPLPDQRMIELTYIGVGSPYRGHGLAKRLLNRALHQISHRNERIITLAVDEANEPALRLYRGAGFHRAERRIALIAPLAAPGQSIRS